MQWRAPGHLSLFCSRFSNPFFPLSWASEKLVQFANSVPDPWGSQKFDRAEKFNHELALADSLCPAADCTVLCLDIYRRLGIPTSLTCVWPSVASGGFEASNERRLSFERKRIGIPYLGDVT